jgi:hypothetical protein
MRSSDYQSNRRSASQVRPLSSPAGLPPNQESPPWGAERRGMEKDGQRAWCPVKVIRRGLGGGRRRSRCVHPSSDSTPANPTCLHGRRMFTVCSASSERCWNAGCSRTAGRRRDLYVVGEVGGCRDPRDAGNGGAPPESARTRGR